MHWQLRGGLMVVILSLALSACDSDKELADPAEWAAGFCNAGQRFADTIANSRDDRDPSSLDLEERKARAVRLGRIEIEAARQLTKDLDAIRPPDEAKGYHDALIRRSKDLAKAVEAQVEAIEEATTAQQIAVANASARFELQGSNAEVTAQAANVPDHLVEALVSQPACGQVPVPGVPEQPVPTPAV